jgi:hypothetical protein
MKITFVTWDDETDGCAVLHDGVQVWQDSGDFDQYIQFHMPTDVPVELDWATRLDGVLMPRDGG